MSVTADEREVLQDMIERALVTDGAHHKQWFLEHIARYLELQVSVEYEPGIAP
jgi:hypothetical protein